MPSAIVAGATGILGQAILNALVKSPEWTSVHAFSRSKSSLANDSKLRHAQTDLTIPAAEIADALKAQNVSAEYLFYAAFVPNQDEAEADRINSAMLANLLEALTISGAAKSLKRVILTTGAKHYGVHLGPVKNPMEETDPWVETAGRPPNFYYTQQRILSAASKKSDPHWDWVVTYPNDVIGFAEGNFMNLASTLALYASISAELSSEKLLDFPGSEYFYTRFDMFTSSTLHAQFSLWAALEEKCGGQAFNAVNGDVESWANLWPKVAERFGCKVSPKMFEREVKEGEGLILEHPDVAPFEDTAIQRGLEGRTRKGKVEMRINLIAWSHRPDVKAAWERLVARGDLKKDGLEKANWIFLGIILGRNSDFIISMSKARKYGWTGYQDSWESLEETFELLEKAEVIPKRSSRVDVRLHI